MGIDTLKGRICDYKKGTNVVPSAPDQDYLADGHTKPVQIITFLKCQDLGFKFVRLTNFGMKQAVDDFLNFDAELDDCAARRFGSPLNYFDSGYFLKLPVIFNLYVPNVRELPPGVRVDSYVMFTPLDGTQNPFYKHGETLTAHFNNLQTVKYIYYNLLFHILRAVHQFNLANVATVKSAARTRLNRYCEIRDRLSVRFFDTYTKIAKEVPGN